MDYQLYSHRHAIEIAQNNKEYIDDFNEILDVLDGISDDNIIEEFELPTYKNNKSISRVINSLIKIRLTDKGWDEESPIFQDDRYSNKRFRLDFAKNNFAVEVAFNHGEAISWNLLKPVLSGELNHVDKAVQTRIGIIIFSTDSMKISGGFDNAVGSYEKALRYLPILMNQLTVPLIIIGLNPPNSFEVINKKINKKNLLF